MANEGQSQNLAEHVGALSSSLDNLTKGFQEVRDRARQQDKKAEIQDLRYADLATKMNENQQALNKRMDMFMEALNAMRTEQLIRQQPPEEELLEEVDHQVDRRTVHREGFGPLRVGDDQLAVHNNQNPVGARGRQRAPRQQPRRSPTPNQRRPQLDWDAVQNMIQEAIRATPVVAVNTAYAHPYPEWVAESPWQNIIGR